MKQKTQEHLIKQLDIIIATIGQAVVLDGLTIRERKARDLLQDARLLIVEELEGVPFFKYNIGDTVEIQAGKNVGCSFVVQEDSRRMTEGPVTVPQYYFRGWWYFESELKIIARAEEDQ